ncbi:MAG: FAD-dependent thymidylate synthase [Patescibacteria group bacterium]
MSDKIKLTPRTNPDARRMYWMNRLEVQREDGTAEELRPTPEVIAVAIAKCSRFDTPFDQNLDDVSLEKAAEFHEKWVVGYGHSSVAEHATCSVAIENISQVLAKIIEDARLASYTEKSTRYQPFSRSRMYVPPIVAQSRLAAEYNKVADLLFGFYEELRQPVAALMRERFPNTDELSEKQYEAQIRGRALDATRCILPAGYLTALGMTANARAWEQVISKLLSHPLEEARIVGEELKTILRGPADQDANAALYTKALPTLLKYADAKPYLQRVLTDVTIATAPFVPIQETVQTDLPRARMTRDDAWAEMRVAAALMMRTSRISYEEALEALQQEPKASGKILDAALANRGAHDAPVRELEHAVFQHEIVTDYGAWKDIQRHRMCTQTNQLFGTELGYVMPDEMRILSQADRYASVMKKADELYHHMLDEGMAHEAQYIIPMAYRKRMLVSWNLRELFHFIELRSGIKGHPEYRRVAQEVWRTLEDTHPTIAKYIRVDLRGNEATTSTVGAKPKGV